ncbi:MAG TPA: TRAP transporter TatT component family protein, partial [Xanthomonadaceae bacterium]|nr:TRAP transporter TatT component family protein [Xanthomonadaceae bacterium]
MRFHPGLSLGLVLITLFVLPGCASVVQKASDQFAANLGSAVLDSDDPATVRDGLPAYLLLLDSLIVGQPDDRKNVSTLLAAAKLDGAYAGNFTGDDKARAQGMSKKAFDYARRATCAKDGALCAAIDGNVEVFSAIVKSDGNTELMYGLASAWAGYLQSHSDDWGAVADLPKVEALL